jgi:transposase InsO family protein
MDDELVDHIQRILAVSPFPGEGYRKVWARLRYDGIRTSPRRVLRLMRAHQRLAPTRQGQPHGSKAHDGTIIPGQIDTMWGTDMTATYTHEDGQVAIFIAVDHCSAECVGIHAAKQGTRFEALEPIRQGVRTAFGAFGQDIAQGLLLRHDHGSQYMSHVFQEELTFLGITRACLQTRVRLVSFMI